MSQGQSLWDEPLKGLLRVERCVVGIAAVLVASAVLGVGAVPAFAAQECPNEAIRTEQGAAASTLPDCRAYEMVSPPGSTPAVEGEARGIAAIGGDRFAYYSLDPYPGSDAEGLYLLATRGANGWSVQNTTPPQGGLHDSDQIACFPSVFYSNELTDAVLSDGWDYDEQGPNQVCEGDDPPLVAGEPRGFANLFFRDDEDGTYRLIDDLPTGQAPANALFWDATSDLGRVVFSEAAKLTPTAPEGLDLYEWAGSSDRLVTYLPDGVPVAGTLVNSSHGSASFTHALSANGETVFFYYEGGLYARLNAAQEATATGACSASEPDKACTVQLDAAQAGAEGTGGDGTFVYASEDGSRVFFTDEQRLTSNATALDEAPDLYEYDLQDGTLTDLTASASGAANVLGFSGASADGSYVYFVAKGVLTGTESNSDGASAVRHRPNLYLSHDGTTTFIATLEGRDHYDWQEQDQAERNSGNLESRVSPNGDYIAFDSVEDLAGAGNEPAEASDCSEDRCSETFVYDAENDRLSCASCAPSGESPTGPAEIGVLVEEMLTPRASKYLTRNVLDDGSVFFDSRSALVPQATNGEFNVYEYSDGNISLISSGTGTGPSEFLDASESGDDVFFLTGQGLVQGDTDNMSSVYDARVDGGFPSEHDEEAGASACEGLEACRPPSAEAPAVSFPASETLPVGGDLVAPPVPVTPQAPSKTSAKKRALTKAQKLARALKTCAKRPRRKRLACEKQARRQFGTGSGQRRPSRRLVGRVEGRPER